MGKNTDTIIYNFDTKANFRLWSGNIYMKQEEESVKITHSCALLLQVDKPHLNYRYVRFGLLLDTNVDYEFVY